MNEPQNRHSHYAEALGAYLLGALGHDERADVERHLEECERCRQDLVELQRAADVLPRSVPPVEPPTALKDRIMRTVEAEAALQASGAGAERAPVRRPSPGRRFSWAIAASAAAVAIGAGVAGIIVVGGSGPPSRGRVVAARITDPRVAAKARAVVRVAGDHARLQVRGLPAPPPQRVYQVWLQAPRRSPVPAGTTFRVRSGTVDIRRPLHEGERVMVTVEPEGGSLAPTRPPLIVALPA